MAMTSAASMGSASRLSSTQHARPQQGGTRMQRTLRAPTVCYSGKPGWTQKPSSWEGFSPDMVDAARSIRTWDVYKIVEINKLKKETHNMAEFCMKLDGEAAEQCWTAVRALEDVQQLLRQECKGDECGFKA